MSEHTTPDWSHLPLEPPAKTHRCGRNLPACRLWEPQWNLAPGERAIKRSEGEALVGIQNYHPRLPLFITTHQVVALSAMLQEHTFLDESLSHGGLSQHRQRVTAALQGMMGACPPMVLTAHGLKNKLSLLPNNGDTHWRPQVTIASVALKSIPNSLRPREAAVQSSRVDVKS